MAPAASRVSVAYVLEEDGVRMKVDDNTDEYVEVDRAVVERFMRVLLSGDLSTLTPDQIHEFLLLLRTAPDWLCDLFGESIMRERLQFLQDLADSVNPRRYCPRSPSPPARLPTPQADPRRDATPSLRRSASLAPQASPVLIDASGGYQASTVKYPGSYSPTRCPYQ
jgi:hypothetical protein